MDFQKHHQITHKFFKEFESFQLNMLRFHADVSLLPMKRTFKEYLRYLKKANDELAETESKNSLFIIKKRIELMIMHIDLILPMLDKFDKDEKDPFEIIRIFDKQHIFKKVLLSHLEDIELLLKD